MDYPARLRACSSALSKSDRQKLIAQLNLFSNKEKSSGESSERKITPYRWFWNTSKDPWQMKNSDHFWAQYDLDISEEVEESYSLQLPYHDLNEFYIIKFDYENNMHRQIEKKDETMQRAVIREIPSKVANLIRIDRIGTRENDEFNFYEKNSIDQMCIFSYSEIFKIFEIDDADNFIHSFTLCKALIDKELASFLSEEYPNYLQEHHKLKAFNFKTLVEILSADFANDKKPTFNALIPYVTIYVNQLTPINFNEIITQMFIEEGQLYKILNRLIHTKSLTLHVEYIFFLLCLLYAITNKRTCIDEDVTVYRGFGMSPERYHKFKQTYSIDQVITNDDFMFTTRHLNLVEQFINNISCKKTILLEIKIEKETDGNALLAFKPFDLSNLSQYTEEEIIIPPGGAFQILQFVEGKGWPTAIQMNYRTNILNDSLPFIHMEKHLTQQFGCYKNLNGMTVEDYPRCFSLTVSKAEFHMLNQFGNLQQLDLPCEKMEEEEIKLFASQLIFLKSLKHLSLYNNKLCFEGFNILFQAVIHLRNLEHLNLGGNRLEDEGAKVLALQLSNLPNIENLNLCENEIGYEGINVLSNQLNHLTRLKHFNLSCNSIGDEGMKALSSQLVFLTYLQALDLRNVHAGYEGIKAFAAQLNHVRNLKKLDLGLNDLGDEGIKTLSNELFHLTQLQELYLSTNQLTCEGIKAFAAQLVYLRNLQDLELCENRIGTEGAIALAGQLHIVPRLQHLNLTCTELGNEAIKAIVSQFCHLTNLRGLMLGRNDFGDDIMKDLASQLVHLTHLHYLDVSTNVTQMRGVPQICENLKLANPFWSSYTIDSPCQYNHTRTSSITVFTCPHDKKELFTQQCVFKNQCFNKDYVKLHLNELKCISNFKYYQNLKSLDLKNNEIGPAGMEAFAPAFFSLSNLQQLNLSVNNLGPAGTKAFVAQLKHLRNLEHLDLSRNQLCHEGCEVLASQLIFLQRLKHLDLSFNKLDHRGMEAFAPKVALLSQLHELNLSFNDIGDYGLKLLAPSLTHLTKLLLCSNNLQYEGIEALAGQLKNSPDLQQLSLSYNQIDDRGMYVLASNLGYITNLEQLHLSENQITSDGLEEIAVQLCHLTQLRELTLSKNEICFWGIKALADQLTNLNNLQELDLSRNKIGNEGIKAFAAQAFQLQNLRKLNLSRNQIDEEGMMALAEYLNHLPQLQELNLFGNKMQGIVSYTTSEEIETFLNQFCINN